jgi:uncharacterized OsmC-like protein
MNDESGSKRDESKAGLGGFSPIQMAIAGLACAVILVILVLIISVLTRAG